MILNNYWNMRYWAENAPFVAALNQNTTTNVKDMNGDNISMFLRVAQTNSTNGYFSNVGKLCANLSHRISDDDSETTKEDYTFSNVLTASNQNIVSSNQNVDGTMKYVFTCTGTNSSNSAITIRKVGIGKTFYKQDGGNFIVSAFGLFAIVDLQESITVPAGQGYSITVDMTEQ